MKTHIYACYLPGSNTPDYIGSHNAAAPDRCFALAWRYEHCTYLGQGAWLSKEDGSLIGFPKINHSTLWGARLLAMSPQERLSIRVEVLQVTQDADRWVAEARAIHLHQPPFNASLKAGPEVRIAKRNAYHRGYRKAYLERNPEKLEAKRAADRARCAAKRAQAKLLKATGTVA